MTGRQLYLERRIIRRSSPFTRFHFYRTSSGAEADLVEIRLDRKPILYERKYSLSPSPSKGLRSCMTDLDPEAAYLVYPGAESYPVDAKTQVRPLLGSA